MLGPSTSFRFRATNSVGDSDYSPSATATTIAALALPSVADQAGFVGVAVNVLLPSATGGAGPYGYTATPLPTSLSFASGTQRITGSPTAAGTTTVTYTVTDGDNDTASRDFDFTITQPLLLTDWDDEDRESEALFLVEATTDVGTSGWQTLYSASEGTLIDGSVTLGLRPQRLI